MKPALTEQLLAAPLFWLGGAFLGGLWLSSWQPLAWWIWLSLAAGLIVLALLARRLRPQLLLTFALLPGMLCLGAARHAWAQTAPAADDLIHYNDLGRKVYVTGTLAEPPDQRDTYMNLRLNVSAIDSGKGDQPASGQLLVKLSNDYSLGYGQAVRVRGELETPPVSEDFSYRDYLAMQGIHSLLKTSTLTLLPFGSQQKPFWALIYRLKFSLYKEINQLFPQPEAALMNGILLGLENDIPASLQQAFKDTGTAHIIAISGFNIAIIAGLFVLLFSSLFGKRAGALLAILGIAGYTLLVGASASVIRAAIMGTLTILAGQTGRRNLGLNTLAAVAALMGLLNAYILWDIGFQLSFMATLGLMLYAEPMQNSVRTLLGRFLRPSLVEAILGPFSDYFLLTFAAQLTTLPVTIYHFGRLSLSSFITNPFVLPAQPPVMILGGLAALAGKLFHPLGQLLAWLTWPFPAYTIRTVEFFARIKTGVIPLGSFSLLTTILIYAALFLLTLFWPRLAAWRYEIGLTFVLVVLGVLTINVWRSAASGPDGRLHVTVLEVGSAEAVLIKTPDGRFLLINGGASPSKLADQLGRRLPPFQRHLDELIIAAPQETQVAALPRLLDQFPPQSVLWAGNRQASYSAGLIVEWLNRRALPATTAKPGDSLDLGQGAALHVLAVSARGAVLSVEWGRFKIILPLGVDYDTFANLDDGAGLGPATALLLSESGYSPSNPPLWLRSVNPEVYLLSVEAGDYQGRPSPDLLESLKDTNLLRTDLSGWIDLATDSDQVWITVERK